MTDENIEQFVTGFNLHYATIMNKLKDYLFAEEVIERDSKWALTKYAMLRTLFDYADEVVSGFSYSPEQLVELIDEHTKFKEKFEKMLKEISADKKEKFEEVIEKVESK